MISSLAAPVEMQLDEEIRISCTYNSVNKLSPTYGDKEQCEATLIYYPQQVIS